MDAKQAETKAMECEASLQICLEMSTSEFGEADALTATILSNYGLFLKDRIRYAEAKKMYEKALGHTVSNFWRHAPRYGREHAQPGGVLPGHGDRKRKVSPSRRRF
jgi:tetratricopeptide (TPR) repeat protein